MQWSLAFTACLSTLITIIAECAVIQTTTISNSANSVSSLTSSLNSSSIFPLGVPSIHCNGDIYRRNLRERSCINAYAGISDDRQLVSFGTRGGPVHWHIDLPFRWISGMLPSFCLYQASYFSSKGHCSKATTDGAPCA